MPSPVCWYHFWPSGLIPAAFQSLFSLACVPELSPRERKVAPARAMLLGHRCGVAACFTLTPPGRWAGRR